MATRDKALDALQGAARAAWVFLKGLGKHDLGGLSAEFAYFFLLSLFPMLLFFAALLSHLATVPQTMDIIFTFMGALFPSEVVSLVQRDIAKWIASGSLTIFSASILVFAWSARNVFRVMLKGFNSIYGEQGRPAWKIHLLSAALVILSAAALGLVFLANLFSRQVSALFDGGAQTFLDVLFPTGEITVTPIVLFATGFCLYSLFPAPRRSIRASAAGALLFTALALAITTVFRLYTNYSMMGSLYGALGTVIVSLMWMYFLGFSFFVGAELTAALLKELKGAEGRGADRS